MHSPSAPPGSAPPYLDRGGNDFSSVVSGGPGRHARKRYEYLQGLRQSQAAEGRAGGPEVILGCSEAELAPAHRRLPGDRVDTEEIRLHGTWARERLAVQNAADETSAEGELDCLGLPRPDGRPLFQRDVSDCHGSVFAAAHRPSGDGPGHVWLVPGSDCCRATACICPACVAHHSRERGGRVLDRLSRIRNWAGSAHLGLVVLTFPSGVKPKSQSSKDQIKELRHAARRAVRDWMRCIRQVEVGGWDVVHPEGDKEHGRWQPHIHLSFVGLDPATKQPIRMVVSKDELGLLRRIWAAELRDLLGYGGDLDRVVVHYRWALDGGDELQRRRYHHRVRYDLRHWPDYSPGLTRIVYWGWLSPAAWARLGIPELDDDQAELDKDGRPKWRRCPCCGVELDVFAPVTDTGSIAIRDGPFWLQDCEVVKSENSF